jgi:hypothetical protein
LEKVERETLSFSLEENENTQGDQQIALGVSVWVGNAVLDEWTVAAGTE